MSTRSNAVTLAVSSLGLIALLTSSCSREPPRSRRKPVRLHGPGVAMPAPYHALSFFFLPVRIERGTTALLGDGDLIYVTRDTSGVDAESDAFLLPYRESDGKSLRFVRDNSRLFMNGTLVGLEITEDEATWDWVRHAEPKELRNLRAILVDADADSNEIDAVFGAIAAVVPRVSLQGKLWPALRWFTPTTIVTPNADVLHRIAQENPKSLSRVESLVVLDPPDTLDFLQAMPRLRALMLDTWDPDDDPFPRPLENLEILNVSQDDRTHEISYLRGCKNLREFAIRFERPLPLPPPVVDAASSRSGQAAPQSVKVEIETTTVVIETTTVTVDWAPLDSLQNLEMLILSAEAPWDPSQLMAPEKLRWLTLGVLVTQEAFESLLRRAPNLEVLSLVMSGEDQIVNYSPIAELKRLSGLSLFIADTTELSRDNLSIVGSMDGLRLLQIVADEGELETATAMADFVRPLIPECDVSVVGYCLGSGWILLLVPLVGIFHSLLRWPGGRQRGPSRDP